MKITKATARTLCLCCLAGLVQAAWAAPTDPVVVSTPPNGQGDAFVPGVRLIADLPQPYVEEEYFVSGGATLYNYAHNPPLGPTDVTAIQEDVPYTTRMILRRPANSADFNGTLVIEWWNSTSGFDIAPAWDTSAEYFARSGIAYLGVTNSTTSMGFLTGGCSLLGVLPPTCGTRYATLSLPENGLAYDMMAQITNLLRSNSPDNPLPADFNTERVFHAGQSQQGGSVITYASAFHSMSPALNDGYFVQQAANARPINFGPACGEEGSPAFPGCTPRLQDADRLVSTGLAVPTYQVVTQTDLEVLFGVVGRQPDSPSFRYYEVAGGSHLQVHKGVEIVPPGIIGPNPILLEEFCLNELNSTADGAVFVSYVMNALWQRMQEQAIDGTAPPAGLEIDGFLPLDRDAQGNVLGGVRLPSMEAPLARYDAGNTADPALPPFLVSIGNLACRLASSAFPFDSATLDTLYPQPGDYAGQVFASTNDLQQQGLLLEEDGDKIKEAACEVEPNSLACNPVPGDINGDGLVDDLDYQALRSSLGKCAGDEGYLASADFNGNDCVAYDDYQIWYRDYFATPTVPATEELPEIPRPAGC